MSTPKNKQAETWAWFKPVALLFSILAGISAAIDIFSKSITVLPPVARWPLAFTFAIAWILFEIKRDSINWKSAPFTQAHVRLLAFGLIVFVAAPLPFQRVLVSKNQIVQNNQNNSQQSTALYTEPKSELPVALEPEPELPVEMQYARLFGAVQVPDMIYNQSVDKDGDYRVTGFSPVYWNLPRSEAEGKPARDDDSSWAETISFSTSFGWPPLYEEFKKLKPNLARAFWSSDEESNQEVEDCFLFNLLYEGWDAKTSRDDGLDAGTALFTEEEAPGTYTPAELARYQGISDREDQRLTDKAAETGYLFLVLSAKKDSEVESIRINYRQVQQPYSSKPTSVDEINSKLDAADQSFKTMVLDQTDGKPTYILLGCFKAGEGGLEQGWYGPVIRIESFEWLEAGVTKTRKSREPLGVDAVRIKVPLGWMGQ